MTAKKQKKTTKTAASKTVTTYISMTVDVPAAYAELLSLTHSVVESFPEGTTVSQFNVDIRG